MSSQDQKQNRSRLNEPDQAVSSYLESLLREVDEYREPEPEAQPTAKVALFPEKELVESELELAEVELEQEEEEAPISTPDWAQAPFQCLLFKVRGVSLAVPLNVLCSIADWKEELHSLPAQPEWHRGVLKHRGTQVIVLDTARLVMPERIVDGEEEDSAPSHILIVGEGRWGLVCEKLLKPITLDPEQVRWCVEKNKPPWMAGTLREQLCILLDVEALLEMVRPDAKPISSN